MLDQHADEARCRTYHQNLEPVTGYHQPGVGTQQNLVLVVECCHENHQPSGEKQQPNL